MKSFLVVSTLSAVVLLWASQTVFAQFAVGPKAGWSLSYVSNLDTTIRLNLGFSAGAQLDFIIKEWLSVQQDILFSQKGSQIHKGNQFKWENFYYVETTVLPKFVWSRENLSPFVSTGPYIGFLMLARFTQGDSRSREEGEIKLREDTRSMDYGWNFACGIHYKPIRIELRYGLGLRNYERYGSRWHTNRTVTVSLGYLFDFD
ncbi:MAG: hypothetical protein KatS3mg031_2050 [Chitinophagales bacterium]|nr:MAG: hypothetical protein KatS3mg031_2050 [Chitinophagales bacterium]